jgi:outer membrane protein TolC
MNKILVAIAFVATLVWSTNLKAQVQSKIDTRFVELVEQNNSTLKAYQDKVEAAKVGARTNLNPANPEVSYSRVSKGSNYDQEVEVTQQIDFPTVYLNKRKGSKIEIERLESDYKAYRQNTIAAAYVAFAEYNYAATMLKFNEQRALQGQKVQDLMQDRFNNGDISSIELSKAKMENALIQKNIQTWKIELNSATSNLSIYIGDVSSQSSLLSQMAKATPSVDTNAETLKQIWMKADSSVINAMYQTQMSMLDVKLKRAQALPKLTLGYRQFKNNSITMNGPTVGLSIPLWENKNKVKQAKLNKIFSESNEADVRLKASLKFEKTWQMAIENQSLVAVLTESLPNDNIIEKLNELLSTGYISMLDYYSQISAYYDLENQVEDAKRQFMKAYIGLYKVVI